MEISAAPPSAILMHVSLGDHGQPAEETVDGQWVIAGRHSLSIVNDQGITESAMWYEIQYAKWDRHTRVLTVFWADPSRDVLRIQTVSTNPKRLMEAMSTSVHHALVTQSVAQASNGTCLRASVRRGADKLLFSMVTADGPVDHDALALAHDLENALRETVGMPPIQLSQESRIENEAKSTSTDLPLGRKNR